jgi:hypothetical protein
MPGPSPKHPDDRARRNVKPSLEVLPVAGPPPAAPANLVPAVAGPWVDLWASPIASTIAPTDLPALERLFALRDEQARCRDLARADPLVFGAQGQVVANPAAKQALALEPAIAALEDRFALNPKARLALGIRMGQAADAAQRHPDLFAGVQEPDPRADPRLAVPVPAAADPRAAGGALDGD